MAGTREEVEKQLKIEMKVPSVGREILEIILGHQVSWTLGNETMRLTVAEVLEKRSHHPILKRAVEGLGVKRTEEGVFLLPKRIQKRILPPSWDRVGGISDIREYVLAIPGAKSKQLRLNGDPRRGVLAPWEGGAA